MKAEAELAPNHAGVPPSHGARASRWAELAIGVISVAFVLELAWVVANRIGYPFDLEWLEGTMIDHVERLRHGMGIYVAPTPDFIPFMYNPLYYLVAVPFTWGLGGYVALRLVSVLATLASFGLIFAIVRRETQGWVPPMLGVGTFAATYPLSGGWFDVGRVDSLCLALCLGAVLAGRVSRGTAGLVGTAALTALAFATKQSAAALVPAMALGVSFLHGFRRSLLWYALPATGMILVTALTLNVATAGWYGFYAFQVPMGHELHPAGEAGKWALRLVTHLPIALAFMLHALIDSRGALEKSVRAYYGVVIAAFFAATLVASMHVGSFLNDDMLEHAGVAIAFGLALSVMDRTKSHPLRVVVAVAAIGQLVMLAYDPRPFVPTARDRAEGDRIVAAIRAFPGDVYVTHQPGLARLAGKQSFANEMALVDIMRTKGDPRDVKGPLRRAFKRFYRRKRWSAVALDFPIIFMDLLNASYTQAPQTLLGNLDDFKCKTGLAVRPQGLFFPR